MNRPMVYGTLMLFLLFMITANPSGTGENGRDFVGWLSSGWDDAREFVDSFVGDGQSDDGDELDEVPIPTLPPEDGGAIDAPAEGDEAPQVPVEPAGG